MREKEKDEKIKRAREKREKEAWKNEKKRKRGREKKEDFWRPTFFHSISSILNKFLKIWNLLWLDFSSRIFDEIVRFSNSFRRNSYASRQTREFSRYSCKQFHSLSLFLPLSCSPEFSSFSCFWLHFPRSNFEASPFEVWTFTLLTTFFRIGIENWNRGRFLLLIPKDMVN